MSQLKECLENGRKAVDDALDRWLPRKTVEPKHLSEAMRYSVFAGGKRLRPILHLMTGRLFEAGDDACMPSACALEMIHTYSLIHDDLPAMDDDDYRRGKLSCHKAFGESIAILAGDALLTMAFETIAVRSPSGRAADLCAVLARAAGAAGMVAGQVHDLEAEGATPDLARVQQIHACKTAALITAAAEMGAVVVNASDEDRARMRAYGQAVGMAFQIRDDILDVTGSRESLGKSAGKDAAQGKMTYPAVMGVEEAELVLADLTLEALEAVAFYGDRAALLIELAESLARRDN